MQYNITASIQEKPSPSGAYWANYNNKLVIAFIEGAISMRLMSNSSKFEGNKEWEKIEGKQGWITRVVPISELIIHEFKF